MDKNEEENEEINMLIVEVRSRVGLLGESLSLLFREVERAGLGPEIAALAAALSLLRRNLETLLGPTLARFKREMEDELSTVRRKYEGLQREWDEQQEHLSRLQTEVYHMRNQLITQSSFCASLGSILGNLVWKATNLQPVVELLLTSNKLTEFFCVASGALISFMDTYQYELPEIKCDEMQFILSLGGIVANIAAVPEGRQLLVTNDNGKDLVGYILRILPSLPQVSGDSLKRILYTALYNVSIDRSGTLLLQAEKQLLVTLAQTLVADRTPELKLVTLRLLESITSQIPDQAILNMIQRETPVQKIQKMRESEEEEIRQYAGNILQNLDRAERSVGHLSRPPPIHHSRN